jgi:hypothetical protein
VKDGQLLFAQRVSVAGGVALALLAGFVASVAMVLAFAIAYAAALILGHLPVLVQSGWFQGLTHNALIDTAQPNLYSATAIFLIGGLLWALLYGLVFEPRLRGPAWERGLTFALIPWLASLLLVMPLVGGGVLGLSLGAGPLPLIGNLILHGIYGAVLGSVYASGETVIDRPGHRADADDLAAGRRSETGAAWGLLAGMLVGVAVGAVGAWWVPQATNPIALVVAVGLSGAAFGGFIGSLSTAEAA